jgi:hypothetical protein
MDKISKYFNAEKLESVVFIFIGMIAIVFAVYFLFLQKENFYKGMAYPLVAVAILQIVVGSSVWIRSPKDIERVEQFIQSSPEQIEKLEIPRMQVVMKNFVIYRYVETALLLFGLLAMFYFGNNLFLKGIGIGLFFQSALMLSLDFFAERRGAEYLQFLLHR